MTPKPLVKGSFGLWRSLDYVFALFLLLQCFSATATTTTGAVTTVTEATATTTTGAVTTVTEATATTKTGAVATVTEATATTKTGAVATVTEATATTKTGAVATVTEATATTKTGAVTTVTEATATTKTGAVATVTEATATTKTGAVATVTEATATTKTGAVATVTEATATTTTGAVATVTEATATTTTGAVATVTEATATTKITVTSASSTSERITTQTATTAKYDNITRNGGVTGNVSLTPNGNMTQNFMTTTISTIFNTSIQIPEISSTPYITVTSALQTMPAPCSFHLSCNQTFYWMAISVLGLFPSANNNKDVQAWLMPVFELRLGTCVNASVSNSTNNTSASSNIPGLFQSMQVSCEPLTVPTEGLCEILLKLSKPVDVCCIENIIRAAGNSIINGTLQGDVQQVGVCLNNTINTTLGPYKKCNHSVSSEDLCSRNFTCENNTNIVPLDVPSTTSAPSYCNCSSSCKSSDAYRIIVNNVNMNLYTFQSFIDQLLKNLSCNSTLYNCSILQTLQHHYLDSKVTNCSGNMNCTVILRLKTGSIFTVCNLKSALSTLIELYKFSTTFSDVTRVAMCSWSSDDPMTGNITWVQKSVSFADFCGNSSVMPFVNCSNESSVAVLLNDSCNSIVSFINATFSPTSSITPPSFTVSTNTSITDAGGLLNMTTDASSLNSSQVDSIITTLERLLSGPNVSVALANTSVGIVNNLLDVPVAVMAPFSNRASGIVNTVGLKLVVSGESETLLTSSLALAVKKVNGTKFQETSFSVTDPSNVQIRSDSRLKRDAQVRSLPLASVILPALMTQSLSQEDQQLASRVQFNYFQKSTFFQDKALGNHKLISGVLSASVANLSISNLQKNVTITLQNTETPGNHTVSCVFWDLGLNGGAGGWSFKGCSKVSSSQQETQCSCNHLTSFGILLDLSKTPIDPLQNTIMTYITYIGCGISAIFLAITLLTYLSFDALRKDIPSKILIHLCFALLLLNLVFLVDGWLAQYPEVNGLCVSTAFFLHYFLLASFTWMAMEAVHMYIALVKVFNTYISRFMLKIGFAGWGLPLVVVIIVIATNHIGGNYGLVSYGKFVDGTPDNFCWITNNIVFYVAVVAYFCIVFLLNFTMFIVVLVQLCRIKRQNPQNVQNRTYWQEIRSVAGLTVLLGLTWGFAFFAWGPVNLAFMYLFAIFNSLQGLFIFIYHCAMKENVRRQWRTYLCCGKLRIPENSEWSRTATQRNIKATKKRPSSTQSNNSSLSFLNNDSTTSDLPMGISNPYDDRVITASEVPSSDVVLNEINNKKRGKKSY